MTNSSAADKAALRTQALDRREGLDAALRADAAARIAADVPELVAKLGGGGGVSGYVPMGAELDCLPALEVLDRAGATLCLPVVRVRNTPLVFRRWRPGEALVTAGFGLSQPPEGAEEIEPEILLMPLLGFDAHGVRLGFGGGYYDRTLARLRSQGAVSAIGLAFAAQEFDALPREDWDELLDYVITEHGVRRFA